MSTPHRCPVCGGSGQVPWGFYNQGMATPTCVTPETCRSCGGTGIVWEPGHDGRPQGKIRVTINGEAFMPEDFDRCFEEAMKRAARRMGPPRRGVATSS